jgi:hypothetical protein
MTGRRVSFEGHAQIILIGAVSMIIDTTCNSVPNGGYVCGCHCDSTTHRDRHRGRCVDARASTMSCHAAQSAGES